MALQPGTAIGFYEIAALIGAGGMGEVYRAHDTRLQREVALKVIRPAALDQPDAADRFLREAMLVSSLNHPNIVTVFETGSLGDDRYIAMELVQGKTLRTIARDGLSIERVCAIGHQVAQALAVAHAARIVHRDVKPENLMVRPDGYVKVLDFGLARVQLESPNRSTSDGGSRKTAPGAIVGTIGYFAPEQVMGEPPTPACDVFALGIVLYELLAGRHPFQGASPASTMQALLWEQPEPPSALNSEVTPALDALVLDALHKSPQARPTAERIADRLVGRDTEPIPVVARPPAPDRKAPPLIVGREAEIEVLDRELDRVRAGACRLVAVSGEAGIGKTTLVEAFLAGVENRSDRVWIGRGRCSERLAGSEAYLPVLEVLDSLQHDPTLGSLSRLTRAMAPSWYVQISPGSREGSSGARLVAETAAGSQERLKREIGALLEEVARRHPVILYFDDVHWADPSTTDVLGYLARRLENARVLIVTTSRPSVLVQNRHPFLPLKLDLIASGVARELSPSSLDDSAVARYLALKFPGHAFPETFSRLIHDRTEGHPLFMADILRDLRRRELVRLDEGRWNLAASVTDLQRDLPESVRSLVLRKMDSLTPEDRQLLGVASVQGVDFDTAVVAAALRLPDEEVEQRLDRLEREHALVRYVSEWEYPDRTLTLRYRFAHHVYQNAFYDSLRITRRVAVSATVGNVLAAHMGDRATEKAIDLALLFETARDGVRAAEYFALAATASARKHAHDETRSLAERGLATLARAAPLAGGESRRAAAELDLRMILGLAIKTSCGYAAPEVGEAYSRARELCREIDDPGRVIPVLIGLVAHYIVGGDIESSRDISVEMQSLFERIGNPHLQMLGEWSFGAALFHLGELEQGHRRSTRGLALYDPSFHGPRVWETGIEPGIFCRAEVSRLECILGEPDKALATVNQAVADARALGHPQTLAFTLLFAAFTYQERREWRLMGEVIDEAVSLCASRGIAQEAMWAEPLAGVALFEQGKTSEGLARIEAGLAAIAKVRSPLLRPFYLNSYADMLLRSGRVEAAQAALEESQEVSRLTSQHAYDAETLRLWAELHIVRADWPQAHDYFRRAIEDAETRGARWLKFRAALGLSQLLLDQGRSSEALEVLRPALSSVAANTTCVEVIVATELVGLLEDRATFTGVGPGL